jgi:hypothetical protein
MAVKYFEKKPEFMKQMWNIRILRKVPAHPTQGFDEQVGAL